MGIVNIFERLKAEADLNAGIYPQSREEWEKEFTGLNVNRAILAVHLKALPEDFNHWDIALDVNFYPGYSNILTLAVVNDSLPKGFKEWKMTVSDSNDTAAHTHAFLRGSSLQSLDFQNYEPLCYVNAKGDSVVDHFCNGIELPEGIY